LLDYQYWLHFGLLNIKIKYRNSAIGPFWNTISLTILILAISFGYASYLVKDDLVNYIYYVSISLIAWQLVANCLNESTLILENKKNLICKTCSRAQWNSRKGNAFNSLKELKSSFVLKESLKNNVSWI
jgi:ABC-type polysaccharide/polyol phosphate export permease